MKRESPARVLRRRLARASARHDIRQSAAIRIMTIPQKSHSPCPNNFVLACSPSWILFRSSIRTRTLNPSRRRRKRSPISSDITITPSSAIRPACRASRSKSPGSIPKKKSADSWPGWNRCETRFNTAGFWNSRAFFDLPPDEHVTTSNWEQLYDNAAKKMAQPDWEQQVLARTKLDAVFLTNNFDDPLEGFDTRRYIPCLRTDDLVFHLGKVEVRQRLEKSTNTDVSDAASLRDAIGKLFDRFVAKGARACAISLPPSFTPAAFPSGRLRQEFQETAAQLNPALDVVLRGSKVAIRPSKACSMTTAGKFHISSSGRSPSSAPTSNCRSIS